MNSDQYEELCRRFVADKVGLSPDAVKSVKIPSPKRPGLPEYQHQIDLYWEISSDIASYLNIANAKWRGSAKVDQPDVMLLQQVRQKVAAHKAFMITNVGFTDGALAAAKDEGIALHVVTPTFNVSELPRAIGPRFRRGFRCWRPEGLAPFTLTESSTVGWVSPGMERRLHRCPPTAQEVGPRDTKRA